MAIFIDPKTGTMSMNQEEGFVPFNGGAVTDYQTKPDTSTTTTPPTTTTPNNAYSNINFETPDEKAFRESNAATDKLTANTAIDEAAIRANTLTKFQAEVDALNKLYEEKKAEERLAGQGRMGGVAAVGARRGLLGSDFGVAQENNQATANAEALSAVENERLNKLNQIYAQVRNYSDKEITDKTAAKKLGAENYLKYISESATRKENNAKEIAKQLYLSGTGDSADFEKIANELGISVEALKTTYDTYKKEQDVVAATKKKEDEAALLKEGYTYVKTPAERDALKAKGYQIVELGGRTYSKVPKTTTKDIKANGVVYQITTDEMGKVINKTVVGSSSTGGSGGGTNKDEKAFDADLKEARKTLAKKGGAAWGEVYDYLVNQYGFSSDEDKYKLDQLLNKEMYTSK